MAKLKRLRTPKFWRIQRKGTKLTVSPRPGPHKKFECIPLQIIARDILKIVETGEEAKIQYGYNDATGDYFITIDLEKCDGCGKCVSACPATIFEIVEEDAFMQKIPPPPPLPPDTVFPVIVLFEITTEEP